MAVPPMERVYQGDLVEIFRLSPGVYFRKADLVTRGQCNGAYLSGGVVGAVDIPSMEGAREMREESRLLFRQPVSHLFITHGHEDHWDGLPAIAEQDITIFCSERLVDGVARRVRRSAGGGGAGRAVIVGVRDRLRVRLGGLEVECRALEGTAHSPWDMIVRVPGEGALCTGDTVVEPSLLHFHDADVENWIASLRSLVATADRFILPGHGDIFPVSVAAETADFIEVLLRAGEACLSRLTAEEVTTMSEERLFAIVTDYLDGSQPGVARIREHAGEGALRELRMVLRRLLASRLH